LPPTRSARREIEERERERASNIRYVTIVGLVCNLALAVIKFAAGVVGSSQAVIADAVHSLSDLSTDLAVLIGVRFWSAPPDECHPHGHARIETAVTMGIGLALAAAGLLLGYNALAGLRYVPGRSPTAVALGAALLSLVAKEALYRWTIAAGRRIQSTAVIANAWHHRSDALSSIPVVLAVGVAMIRADLSFVDRVGAVLVSYLIIRASWTVIRPALGELVDRGASEEVRRRVELIARETPGVLDVHAVRTRYTGSRLSVDLHALVDPTITVREGHDIAEHLKERLLSHGPDVMDVVVHLEPFEAGKGDEEQAGEKTAPKD